jgi:hypothetical protein
MSISVLCPSSRGQGINEEVHEDDKDQPVCGVVVAKNWNKQITESDLLQPKEQKLFVHQNISK